MNADSASYRTADCISLWLLRAAVAFAFLFPALHAYSDPFVWLGYVPDFARGFMPDLVLLHVFGGVEIVLALWLLSGWRGYIPASIMAFILLFIVAIDMHEFTILFRDISIAAAAIALAFVEYKRSTMVP